jgi:hypothetical protein
MNINLKHFCSAKCFARAMHFKRQILTSPLWLRDEDPVERQETTFELLKDDTELHGLRVNLTGLKLSDDDLKKSRGDEEDSSSTSDDE